MDSRVPGDVATASDTVGTTPSVAVVIAAGGAGRRMGGLRKQYLELLGEPILVHSIRPFLQHPDIGWAVIAIPADDLADPPEWLTTIDPRVSLVAGGTERGDSVRNALESLPDEVETVLVHDAARPLVELETIDRAITAARTGKGAIAGTPLTDTLKVVDQELVIRGTPDRDQFWRAQTPQAFPRELLLDAARRALADGYQATDDAALVEHYGGTVVVVEGAPENLKVTTPIDLMVAESIMRARAHSENEMGQWAPAERSRHSGAGCQVEDGADQAGREGPDTPGEGDGGRGGREPLVVPFRSTADRERSSRKVAGHLRTGGLIAYPTETVYGLGCSLQPDALERLAELKGKDDQSPFLILIEQPEQLPQLVWTESALRLAAAFWPGPLTLALRAEPGHFPDRILGPGGTVAVRSSPHPAVRAILSALGEPITSTSANLPGHAPSMSGNQVMGLAEEFGSPAELWVLDGGSLPPSAPSTIVDCSGARPRVLREGALPVTTLAGVIGFLESGPAAAGELE